MTKIEIKRNNEVIFSTPINEGCLRRCTLMQEDYVTLKFNLTTPVYLKLGDSIMDGAFEIVDLTAPTYNQNNGAYEYEVRFDAYYWKWKNKKFFYSPEHGAREAVWNLTADLPSQLNVFLRNLKYLYYNYNGQDFEFVVNENVDNKSISMHYDKVNLIDALTMLAEAWECEWWITDNIIHLGRCEYGTPVDFKLNDNVQSMIRNDGQQNFATRIYAFGSARNIPRNYRPHSDEVAINGIIDKRLMLPEGTPFIDAYPDMKQEEAIEEVVIFDEIYPSRTNNITEVREKEGSTTEEGVTTKFWTYWIKDESLEFKDEYVLPNEELRITFQSGALNGMDFALGFHQKSNEFEIIRNEDYGRLLPDDVLKPKVGDKFILYGYDTKFIDDQLLPEAELRLKEKATEYVEKLKVDPSTYENKMMSDFMFNKGEVRTFELGDKVNLINPTYFEEGRQSRIIGYEYPLDKPYDNPIYYVGETASYSRLNELEDKVNELVYKDQIFQSTQGKGVYVVGQYDSTKPTDRNVLSSLRSLNTFLRKDQDDSTEHLITFLAGLKLGETFGIDKEGNASLNNIKSVLIDSIQAKFHELEATNIKGLIGSIDTLTAISLFVKGLAEVKNLNVQDTATMLNVVVKASISSPTFVSGFLGEGFRLAKTAYGNWNLEVDNLTVRKTMKLFELIVQRIVYQGGMIIRSAAGGKITNVIDKGTYWRCEHDGLDDFFEDDQVVCQTFKTQKGNAGVKRYWRLALSSDRGYVDLSKTDCEPESDVPEVGDEIVQLGNRTNVARQNAQLISVVGEDAPYIDDYMGIDSYSLVGKLVQRSGNLTGIIDKDFGQLKGSGLYSQNAYLKGSFNLRNGKTVETVISETSSKLSSDIGKVRTDLQGDIANSKKETQGQINSSVSSVRNELNATVTQVEHSFNNSIDKTKGELSASINKVQGDADTAKGLAQSAQDAVDGLEIGGRNLIVKSRLKSGYINAENGVTIGTSSRDFHDPNFYVIKPSTNKRMVGSVYGSSGEGVSSTGWVFFYGEDKEYLGRGASAIWWRDRVGVSYITIPNNARYYRVSVVFPNDVLSKLEYGNTPTDWTPAPEDIENQISEVETSIRKEITTVEQRFEIADGQINSHIKETTQLVTEAKLANGESVKTLEQVKVQISDINVTAGQINSTLGEVTKKQGEINSSISNLEQTAGSIKTSIEGFKETEAEIKATANKIEASHEGIVLEASEKSAQKAIDGLEIGGRNLISGSGGVYLKRLGAYGRKIVEYNGKISVLHDRGTMLHFAAKTTDTIKKGGSYVYSFKMCCNEGIVKMASHIYINGKEGNIRSVNDTEITTEWKMFYISSVAKGDIKEVAIHHYLAKTLTDTDQIVYLTEYKLEKGTKPTDWSPAPEDIDAQFTETKASLKVLSDQLVAEVSKTNGISKDLTAVKQDHNSFKVQVKTDISGAINSNNEVILSSFKMDGNKIGIGGKYIDLTGKVTFSALNSESQNKINTATKTANNAAQDIFDLKLEVGDLAYLNTVEKAQLGTTVIDGGFLRTDLLQAKSIKAEKLDIDSIFAQRIRTGNLDVLDGAKIGEFSIKNSYFQYYTEMRPENYRKMYLSPQLLSFTDTLSSDKVKVSVGSDAVSIWEFRKTYLNVEAETNSVKTIGINTIIKGTNSAGGHTIAGNFEVSVANPIANATTLRLRGGSIDGFALKTVKLTSSTTIKPHDAHVVIFSASYDATLSVDCRYDKIENGYVIIVSSVWNDYNISILGGRIHDQSGSWGTTTGGSRKGCCMLVKVFDDSNGANWKSFRSMW